VGLFGNFGQCHRGRIGTKKSIAEILQCLKSVLYKLLDRIAYVWII